MRTIDIRTEGGGPIDRLVFGESGGLNVAYALSVNPAGGGPETCLFIDAAGTRHVAVRREDVSNLIKALQKAQEIWEGCE